MTEPTTEAGRRLVADEPRVVIGPHDMRERVLAIEAEARADAEITWKADEIRTAFAAGQAEARATALDVERLMDAITAKTIWPIHRDTAALIAAEYARLARAGSDGA